MNLDRLDSWADSAKRDGILRVQTSISPGTLAELVDYARERAAREACEAALPEGAYIWTEGPYDGSTDELGNTTILGFCVHAFQRVTASHVQSVVPRATGLTLTAAYLALLEKLEAGK